MASLWRGKSNQQSTTAINNHFQAMTQPAVFFYPLLRPPLYPIRSPPTSSLAPIRSHPVLSHPLQSHSVPISSHPILLYAPLYSARRWVLSNSPPPPRHIPFPSDHSQSIPSNSRHSAMHFTPYLMLRCRVNHASKYGCWRWRRCTQARTTVRNCRHACFFNLHLLLSSSPRFPLSIAGLGEHPFKANPWWAKGRGGGEHKGREANFSPLYALPHTVATKAPLGHSSLWYLVFGMDTASFAVRLGRRSMGLCASIPYTCMRKRADTWPPISLPATTIKPGCPQSCIYNGRYLSKIVLVTAGNRNRLCTY